MLNELLTRWMLIRACIEFWHGCSLPLRIQLMLWALDKGFTFADFSVFSWGLCPLWVMRNILFLALVFMLATPTLYCLFFRWLTFWSDRFNMEAIDSTIFRDIAEEYFTYSSTHHQIFGLEFMILSTWVFRLVVQDALWVRISVVNLAFHVNRANYGILGCTDVPYYRKNR